MGHMVDFNFWEHLADRQIVKPVKRKLEKWVAWIDPADDNIIPINGKKK